MQPLKKLFSFRIYTLALIEAAIVMACFAAAFFIYDPLDAGLYLQYEGGIERVALVVIVYLLTGYLAGLFRITKVTSRLIGILQVCQSIGAIMVFSALMTVINPDIALPQNVLLAGSVIAAIVIAIWRIYIRPLIWAAFGAQKVLVVGHSRALDKLVCAYSVDPSLALEVVGSVTVPGLPAAAEPVLGSLRELRRIIAPIQPDRIVVGGDISDTAALKALLDSKAAGIQVETASQMYEAAFGRIDAAGLKPYAVIYRDELSSRPASVALQSVYNNILGLAVVIGAVPAIIPISVVVKMTTNGPVFKRIRCAGLHGIPFDLYRFDTRSPVGRRLERYHLAGLPQVLNIVRGEVALIGPRADRVEYDHVLAELIPFYNQRQHVKPGLMGWSQLHCDPLPEEHTASRIEHDLYYIKHISVVVDAYIVLRALKKALSDRSEEEVLVDTMAVTHS